MSVADKLQRLGAARTNIQAALDEKGVTATGHGFEDFAADIASISSGTIGVVNATLAGRAVALTFQGVVDEPRMFFITLADSQDLTNLSSGFSSVVAFSYNGEVANRPCQEITAYTNNGAGRVDSNPRKKNGVIYNASAKTLTVDQSVYDNYTYWPAANYQLVYVY